MPSVPCPHCRTENGYPAEEAGRARTCVSCGRAIPSQLTVPPDATPHVKATAIGAASRSSDEPFRASFAEAGKGKSGIGQGAMMALIIVMAFAMLGYCFWFLAGRSGGGEPPAIVESPKPPIKMSQLAFQKDKQDFVIYFTLLDDEGQQIARPGQVRLTISEVTRLSIEGRGQFSQESHLYDNGFNVSPSDFVWYDPGGFTASFRRLVCAMRVPITSLSRQPQPTRRGKVTVKFTDAKSSHATMKLSQEFFF